MQDNISRSVPIEDKLCPTCLNTKLVECKTGDQETPIVFMGCHDCKRENNFQLPTYQPEFELVNRWGKWKPQKNYTFDELTQKWLTQALASQKFFNVDQGSTKG